MNQTWQKYQKRDNLLNRIRTRRSMILDDSKFSNTIDATKYDRVTIDSLDELSMLTYDEFELIIAKSDNVLHAAGFGSCDVYILKTGSPRWSALNLSTSPTA